MDIDLSNYWLGLYIEPVKYVFSYSHDKESFEILDNY